MGLCGITGSHWLVGRRVSGEGGSGVKKTRCLLECQSEEQEVWHVRVDFNKVTDKRRSSVSSVKRGRYVGTRRFRVRGQRTPEVNKVALKYFNALIAAKLIASINALTLTALVSWLFGLVHLPSTKNEEAEVTTYTTTKHQGAFTMLWLHFWVEVMPSVNDDGHLRLKTLFRMSDFFWGFSLTVININCISIISLSSFGLAQGGYNT